MNENIDLTKILKDCPKGWKLWSPIFGEIEFCSIAENVLYPIILFFKQGIIWFSKEGLLDIENEGAECVLFPSKDQRDWNKFTAPWYKNKKFDPRTLQPFDQVLARDTPNATWSCKNFSHIMNLPKFYKYATTSGFYKYCIPYNDDTKHLVGTKEEAPEFYRHWEE